MNYVEVFLIAFFAGTVWAWPTFFRVGRDLWRHGFDNHFCNVVGCCR